MSTSLLYHGFGIVGSRYVRQQFLEGRIRVRIEQPRARRKCTSRQEERAVKKTEQPRAVEVQRLPVRSGGAQAGVDRTIRASPSGRKPVEIAWTLPRVLCFACGRTRPVKVGFADPQRRSTWAFERYARELSRRMTIQNVAEHLQVGSDAIKAIQRRHLQRRFGRPKLRGLREIAIDEVAIGKGHRYLTIVLDLRSGAIVFVGDGTGVAALEPFWKRRRRSRAQVRAVATDMGQAYLRAVRENLPRAVHVFDHFHVVKLFNEKLSARRRELYHRAASREERAIRKGTRWLLLKNPENLDPTRSEPERLAEALRLNAPLATAYYLKADLRQIWTPPTKRVTRQVLRDWVKRARATGERLLIQFADPLSEHQKGVLAYYDYPISTGLLEGTNNKIQTLQRPAYGFRDHEFYKRKILGLHETKHALVG